MYGTIIFVSPCLPPRYFMDAMCVVMDRSRRQTNDDDRWRSISHTPQTTGSALLPPSTASWRIVLRVRIMPGERETTDGIVAAPSSRDIALSPPPTHPTRGGTLGLPQRDTYIIRQHAPPRPTRRAESPPIILLFAERPPPPPRQKTDEAKRVWGDPSISSSSHPVETRQLPPRACSPFRAKDGV